MTAPLARALPFIEGETLSGYVSRNARLHEATPRDFCSDLGMRWPFLCSGHDDQVEQLAWLTGEPLDIFRTWRTQKVGIGRYRVGQAIASTGVLRRTAVRLCPKCVSSALSEHGPSGVFQLLEWSVLCIERCARHGCPLIILPSEGHSHSIYDFVSRVLERQDEVQRAAEANELLQATRFETYVRHRIWYGPADDWLQDAATAEKSMTASPPEAPSDGVLVVLQRRKSALSPKCKNSTMRLGSVIVRSSVQRSNLSWR